MEGAATENLLDQSVKGLDGSDLGQLSALLADKKAVIFVNLASA